MRIVAIIQARMGSTRLPGKVLLDLAGKTILERVVSRCRRAKTLNELVIATTTQSEDDVIVRLCSAGGWTHVRGSEHDVLDRYYQAAMLYRADVVVRITSDCPLIEPEIIDQVVTEFLENGPLDYASNTLPPRTFPRGLDTEVISFRALEGAWRNDGNPAWREHATPYIYRHPEKYLLRSVVSAVDHSAMRWTVDTAEDLAFVRCIYDHFVNDHFSWREVLVLLEQHPDWLEINGKVRQKVI